jgi:hypothetical protein
LIEQKRFKARKNADTSPPAKKSSGTSPRCGHRSESSFIRTMTVGLRVELSLLTSANLAVPGALAGSRFVQPNRLPPVGNFTPP